MISYSPASDAHVRRPLPRFVVLLARKATPRISPPLLMSSAYGISVNERGDNGGGGGGRGGGGGGESR